MSARARVEADEQPPPTSSVRTRTRGRTVSIRSISRRELELGRRAYPPEEHAIERPRTRGECRDGPRPCPWIACRYHLYLDVTDRGSIRINHAGEPDELVDSCALDMADAGPRSFDGIGRAMNVSRSRVEQLAEPALERVRRRLRVIVGE